ncbi:hypothetical protein Z946_3251 [Sulfitobacter noctilucicola]|uniref:AAA+ family ATPase n=1 Tax=Sulfitobacter noctilucicola TaxID=1342301 RepID=A0A7W6M8R8_9RHOB|nr:hypothetical protein [Sulfitobacter noctilucicola]KIN64360.1 hypothetical protein Z946_3251 [Sulfitobacter noctilucicola]MBB4174479.1 hypothetical protein [Sulfitobacter noctilucicola]
MKQICAAAFVLCLLPVVSSAQEASPPQDDGLSLMERGAQLFMEGILKEMEPAIEEFSGLADQMAPALRQFADEMGPKLTDLLSEVEDWSVYQAPEILPNGDIIIRRKPDRPVEPPKAPAEAAPQIDL